MKKYASIEDLRKQFPPNKLVADSDIPEQFELAGVVWSGPLRLSVREASHWPQDLVDLSGICWYSGTGRWYLVAGKRNDNRLTVWTSDVAPQVTLFDVWHVLQKKEAKAPAYTPEEARSALPSYPCAILPSQAPQVRVYWRWDGEQWVREPLAEEKETQEQIDSSRVFDSLAHLRQQHPVQEVDTAYEPQQRLTIGNRTFHGMLMSQDLWPEEAVRHPGYVWWSDDDSWSVVLRYDKDGEDMEVYDISGDLPEPHSDDPSRIYLLESEDSLKALPSHLHPQSTDSVYLRVDGEWQKQEKHEEIRACMRERLGDRYAVAAEIRLWLTEGDILVAGGRVPATCTEEEVVLYLQEQVLRHLPSEDSPPLVIRLRPLTADGREMGVGTGTLLIRATHPAVCALRKQAKEREELAAMQRSGQDRALNRWDPGAVWLRVWKKTEGGALTEIGKVHVGLSLPEFIRVFLPHMPRGREEIVAFETREMNADGVDLPRSRCDFTISGDDPVLLQVRATHASPVAQAVEEARHKEFQAAAQAGKGGSLMGETIITGDGVLRMPRDQVVSTLRFPQGAVLSQMPWRPGEQAQVQDRNVRVRNTQENAMSEDSREEGGVMNALALGAKLRLAKDASDIGAAGARMLLVKMGMSEDLVDSPAGKRMVETLAPFFLYALAKHGSALVPVPESVQSLAIRSSELAITATTYENLGAIKDVVVQMVGQLQALQESVGAVHQLAGNMSGSPTGSRTKVNA